jgi:hypothetical protein
MPVAPADYRPTLADLGAIMSARTVDGDGNHLGTFSADTIPTDVQATAAIDRALGLVAPRLGAVPADADGMFAEMARSIVALRAAMFVETSYIAEETSPDSSFASYRDQYRDALTDYDVAVERNVGEGTTSTHVASVRAQSALVAAERDPAPWVDPTAFPPLTGS